MSHLSTVKTVIKDLPVLKEAASKMGLVFHSLASYNMNWAGEIQCEGVLCKEGEILDNKNGAALIKDGDNFKIAMDNYRNPITEITGADCSKLMQNYATDIVSEEMLRQGFLETENVIDQKTGDRIMIFQD